MAEDQSNNSNSEGALDPLVSMGPNDHSLNIPRRSEQEQRRDPDISKSLDTSKQAEATTQDQAGKKTDRHQDNDDPYSDILPEIERLRVIKDIYDELNILKGLAEDQEHVWEQFWGRDVLENRAFNYDTPSEVIEEIDEMREQAKSVLDDLNSLLDLKQKQANINEAQSSRDQSDTVMVFTTITILFVGLTSTSCSMLCVAL
ncbi:uncharacterized protein BDV14DRAFT_199415 [Aspergillus stella-maris]|uniref:uncharacterized protein n=1 Tax=Aspergillus stella-maris TaxID=1810926 RepID=UPI003CCC9C26